MNSVPMVPRIEDLPYLSSPPIEFTYSSTASLSAGSYTWADTQNLLIPNRPLMENTVYYFRSITLAANTDELDFTSNITTIPNFQMFLKSRAKAILFREPIYMTKFLQNFDYRFAWVTQRASDTIYASFNGVLKQGASLIGKATVTLNAVISAQEIVDEGFVKKFRESYPAGGFNG